MSTKLKILFGLGIIALFCIIAADLTLFLVLPKINMEWMSTNQLISTYFAYYTTQSNWLFIGYMTFVYVYKVLLNKKTNFYVDLAIVIYITITLIVYWLGVAVKPEIVVKYEWFHWVISIVLHLGTPAIGIWYFYTIAGETKISYKSFLRKQFLLILIFPIIWITFAMVRGEILFNTYNQEFFEQNFIKYGEKWYTTIGTTLGPITDWKGSIEELVKQAKPFEGEIDYIVWWPYFFMDIKEYVLSDINGNTLIQNKGLTSQILVFVSCTLGIMFAIFAIQFGYVYLNNRIITGPKEKDKNRLKKTKKLVL